MIRNDGDQTEAVQSVEAETPVAREAFGSMMKSAREAAGYSVERIAMATRISQPFIEALEAEKIESLPGPMFGRGFIRNLCKAYGKNPAEYLEGFERLLVAHGQVAEDLQVGRDERRHQQLKKGVLLIQPNEWKGRFKSLAPHHYLQPKPLAVLAAALLVIVAGSSFFRSQSEKAATEKNLPISEPLEAPTAPAPEAEALVAPAVEKLVEKSLPAAPAPSPAASPAPAPKVEGSFQVEMRVLEPVEVTIGRDQEKQTTEKLEPKTYHYAFLQQLKLYVENAGVVEIYFNGQRVGREAKKGEPKRFTFAASEGELAKKRETPKALR